jgi:uncharacterized protein (TIGR03437 family)
MKFFATTVAILAVCAAPSFAGESSKFFRPHYNARKALAHRPRASGGAVIVNAASYEEGISPGGLATIFGDNLTTVTGIVYANANPLPDRLAGVEVFVSGIPAPIYGIAYSGGQDQISVQVPYEAPTGPGAAEIQVYDEGTLVADFVTDSFTEDPGLFTYDGGLAIAEAADYSLIGPDNPANPGEALVLYVTGLGPLDDPNLVDGYGAPSSEPFARTVDPFQVVVDNENCQVFFSGLAPGFVGLYQINFYVPQDAAAGNLPIFIQDTYANSAVAMLPVQ